VPIADEGAKFENFVAFHLIKWVHFNQDTEGKDIELNYFRDTDGREVDFVVTEKRKPILLVEVKLKEQDISKSLYYAKQKFPECKAYQLYLYGTKDYEKDGIRVCHAWELLKALV
jgi:predicted AAA+ superfamily ATPase